MEDENQLEILTMFLYVWMNSRQQFCVLTCLIQNQAKTIQSPRWFLQIAQAKKYSSVEFEVKKILEVTKDEYLKLSTQGAWNKA